MGRKRALIAPLITLGLTGCSSLLYYPTPYQYVSGAQLPEPNEYVRLRASDRGVNSPSPPSTPSSLSAWRIDPPDRTAPVRELVIVQFHGNAQNLSSHFYSVYWLARAGYRVWSWDYPGYGDSPGHPSPEATVQAGQSVLAQIAERSPGARLIVIGQSLGGAIALRTAIELKRGAPTLYSRIAGIVIDSSFASYQRAGRRVLARAWLSWPFQWLAWLTLSDRWSPEGAGPRAIAELAPTPLLVMHERGDPVVSYELGEDVYARAASPKEFWTVEPSRKLGAGHVMAWARPEPEYRDRFAQWLERLRLDSARATSTP